ncbi:succinylglutamate desuccinylase/aspartoacylase family protein [Undibacterium cyanobacteriorum]|uniref:Succinylglutamate desuccinylase/aspartoacylase family protein n=1 Tax=Undibacterium cyanobacteriorum TaxID=3073561 RepID=A0ABY9RGK3_9BURK|nr:succinylglutamate desuccinylase/aspartoacylase family protein [Undibacterium sp. 20NA77.5]WMW80086.1 succinylglutamate desuccinylase/aspartoacylase family protein [Undibacterium sp. 20NA77.5]
MSTTITPASLQFQCTQFTALQAGPKVLITGAVHGDETCGTVAIRRIIAELSEGTLVLQRGHVSFVPVTNVKAYAQRTRFGDRNLNRLLQPVTEVKEFEDQVANWLCPLMAQHEVLLDLHSFRDAGQAFAMMGPENNEGPIEPFRHARAEEAFALCLGVQRYVDGWLSTYSSWLSRQGKNDDWKFGVGTTEYMRSIGGYALTLECGSHRDPQAPEVAYRAIRNALHHLGLLNYEHATDLSQARAQAEMLSLYHVVDRLHENDQFCRDWRSFDALKAGDHIGTRADGSAVLADIDGYIVFPDTHAAVGSEWFYLARRTDRLQRDR